MVGTHISDFKFGYELNCSSKFGMQQVGRRLDSWPASDPRTSLAGTEAVPRERYTLIVRIMMRARTVTTVTTDTVFSCVLFCWRLAKCAAGVGAPRGVEVDDDGLAQREQRLEAGLAAVDEGDLEVGSLFAHLRRAPGPGSEAGARARACAWAAGGRVRGQAGFKFGRGACRAAGAELEVGVAALLIHVERRAAQQRDHLQRREDRALSRGALSRAAAQVGGEGWRAHGREGRAGRRTGGLESMQLPLRCWLFVTA